MCSIVCATANNTSADPRQSTTDRTIGLNCTGRMTESEAQFSAAGFHVVAVQEGRMRSRTVLSGNTYRMDVLEGVGTTHSLGLQMWVHKSLTAAHGPVTVVLPRIMCLNLKMRDKCDTTRIKVINAPLPGINEQESERWNEHFAALLCGDLVDTLVEPPAPATPATHDVDEALAAIGSLTDEVQRVITGLPNNKAPGMDQIPTELWKAGHEVSSNESHG